MYACFLTHVRVSADSETVFSSPPSFMFRESRRASRRQKLFLGGGEEINIYGHMGCFFFNSQCKEIHVPYVKSMKSFIV